MCAFHHGARVPHARCTMLANECGKFGPHKKM
jgi:hypothetical protein